MSAALATGVAIHLPFSIPLDARVQHDVEYGSPGGRPVCTWLTSCPEGEAVVAEAAGYFGYYGRMTLWDFPG